MKIYNLKNFLVIFLGVTFVSLPACIFENHITVQNALTRFRQIREAEGKQYQTSGRFATLMELSKKGAIPQQLRDGEDMNYKFDLEVTETNYSVNACPLSDTGSCFFMDETGIIRASLSSTKPADKTSPAIKNQ